MLKSLSAMSIMQQPKFVTVPLHELEINILYRTFHALPFVLYADERYYEGNSISKLQIVIEKNRMKIMTYKQHLFFNIISIQI